jgi:hypothetical protein
MQNIVVKTELQSQRAIWSKLMQNKDDQFTHKLEQAVNSTFDGIRIASLKKLMNLSAFSESSVDPRDILCFVEKCVDERFMYKRELPSGANKDPLVKYNYRQQIVDFGIPGVGCLYSEKESKLITLKIANYLQKNQIPLFVSEAHEGCGAVSVKLNNEFSFTNSSSLITGELLSQTANSNAKNAANLVKKAALKNGYKVKTYSKYATMEGSCYRVDDGLNEQIAKIHNGSGIIFMPNFLDKEANAKVFLPDKFCLANDVCMFNMIDSGQSFDANHNSTASYILFCIKIMLGEHGLGTPYFKKTPLTIMAACDINMSIDTLRAYQVINQVRELASKDELTKDLDIDFDYVILEF